MLTPDQSDLILSCITFVLAVGVAFKLGRDWDELGGVVRRRRRVSSDCSPAWARSTDRILAEHAEAVEAEYARIEHAVKQVEERLVASYAEMERNNARTRQTDDGSTHQ